MDFDPAGTAPGLSAKKEEPKKVNMRCKNSACDSIEATPIALQNSNQRAYTCVKCHLTWGVNVGGAFNL